MGSLVSVGSVGSVKYRVYVGPAGSVDSVGFVKPLGSVGLSNMLPVRT